MRCRPADERLQHGDQLARQTLRDRARQARRRHDADPPRVLEAREAEFGGGRHARQRGNPLRRRDGKAAQLGALKEADRRRDVQ
jgi:hypothetical protein